MGIKTLRITDKTHERFSKFKEGFETVDQALNRLLDEVHKK